MDLPVEVLIDPLNNQNLIRSLSVQTCPKCGGYMTTIPVDYIAASLIGTLGRRRCQTCGYIPSLDIYDKLGAEQEKQLLKRVKRGDVHECLICGTYYKIGEEGARLVTCSDACHEKFVQRIIEEFGEFKKVVDKQTGIAYRVPTEFILERGLKYKDLKQFPEWAEKEA